MKQKISIASPVDLKKTQQRTESPTNFQNTTFLDSPSESFIFSYDGSHKDFFQELIAKSNERFKGTYSEIPTGSSGEIQGDLIKRMGLITTIYNDSQLRSTNLSPITPTQSEYLFKRGKLKCDMREDLGMILYYKNKNGCNSEARKFYKSLKEHRQDLNLSESDLESNLVMVNPGAEVDSSMPYGIKLIILPGLTQVYQHEVLEKVGGNLFNGYGLNGGLPLLSQLGHGNRTLYLPNKTENTNSHVLYRDWDLNLFFDAGIDDRNSIDRITFARRVAPKN